MSKARMAVPPQTQAPAHSQPVATQYFPYSRESLDQQRSHWSDGRFRQETSELVGPLFARLAGNTSLLNVPSSQRAFGRGNAQNAQHVSRAARQNALDVSDARPFHQHPALRFASYQQRATVPVIQRQQSGTQQQNGPGQPQETEKQKFDRLVSCAREDTSKLLSCLRNKKFDTIKDDHAVIMRKLDSIRGWQQTVDKLDPQKESDIKGFNEMLLLPAIGELQQISNKHECNVSICGQEVTLPPKQAEATLDKTKAEGLYDCVYNDPSIQDCISRLPMPSKKVASDVVANVRSTENKQTVRKQIDNAKSEEELVAIIAKLKTGRDQIYASVGGLDCKKPQNCDPK